MYFTNPRVQIMLLRNALTDAVMKLTASFGVLDNFFFGKIRGRKLSTARKPVRRNEMETQAAHAVGLLERSNEPPQLSAQQQYYITFTSASDSLPSQV